MFPFDDCLIVGGMKWGRRGGGIKLGFFIYSAGTASDKPITVPVNLWNGSTVHVYINIDPLQESYNLN